MIPFWPISLEFYETVILMPQTLLPLFCEDVTPINELLAYAKRDGQVYYFHAGLPIFNHAEQDERSFRLITAQLAVNGACRQAEIVRAFGISAISMKRWAKRYREQGAAGFFSSPRKRKPRVLMDEVLVRAQELLSSGESRAEVADALGIKRDTFCRAIRSGRLVEAKKNSGRRARKASEA